MLALVTVATCGYFAVNERLRSALILLVAVVTGTGASTILKESYDRPRPQLVPHRMVVFTNSFPSGHAMMSTVTYLTAASLVVKNDRRKRVRFWMMLVALWVVALIGLSRIYLGVHWPSDVLGGWIAGTLWAGCAMLVSYLKEPILRQRT